MYGFTWLSLVKISLSFGTPLKIKSDNGPPFNGEEFINFSKIHGLKHRKLTPKHLRSSKWRNRKLYEANKEISSNCKGGQSRLQSRSIDKNDGR